jgi:four helix bundle protein
MLKSFRELEVWQKAHSLVLEIYRVTARFPDSEKYGIVSQLRRAAMSIPANIAEGFGRRGTKEFLQCLAIGNGSLEETRFYY